MSDEIVTIVMAGETQQVNLADLMSIDLGEVEEFRGGEAMPAGISEWRIKECGMDTQEINDAQLGEKVVRPRVWFKLEVLTCRQLLDASIDKDTLVGAEHNERFFIKDVLKDIGRVKAFLTDIGREGSGALSVLLDQSIGHEFIGGIKHTKSKNDASVVYGNLDMKSLKPMGGAATAAPAAPKVGGLFGKK